MLAAAFIDASSRLVWAHRCVSAVPAHLPLTLDTVGVSQGDTAYVGFLPLEPVELPGAAQIVEVLGEVALDWKRLAPPIRRALGRARFRTYDDAHRAVVGQLVSMFDDAGPSGA